MNLTELQERLEECFDAQRKNEKAYLEDAIKLHPKLTDYIVKNGIDSEAEKKIDVILQIKEMYESFDNKITTYIKNLTAEIEKKSNNNAS